MKYTVIVAEDEELLLNNLVQKIQKADPDFQVAGTAQTGDQALALIEQLSPDLVVTDIRMPVMDGITLLSRVREQFPFTKFIITSGFSDFEYARKAIHLGVSDYLLKPIVPKTLEDILHSCLEQQKAKIHLLQKEYLQCALRSNNPAEPAPDFMDSTSCSFIFVFQGPLRPSIYSETISDSDFAPISPEYMTTLENEFQVSLILLHGRHFNEQVYAVTYPSSRHPDIEGLAGKIHSSLDLSAQHPESWINTVLSPRSPDSGSVSDIIKDTYLFALFKNGFGSSSLQTCSILSNQKMIVSPDVQQLCAGITALSDQESLYHMIHSLIIMQDQKELSQFQLTANLRYFFSAVIQNSHKDIIYPDVSEIVSTSHSYDELERELQYETSKICGFQNPAFGEELPSLARQVRNYLDRNFTQQITTKSFQDIFGYNEKYISTLFKSEFGISPSKYISELRLKMAKTLLQNNPDILTKDVAEMVGFSDAFYFSRVFKAHEGMSPSQYLKQLKK